MTAAQSLQGALPAGWRNMDFGAPTVPGSADYTDGTWVVSSGGADLCATNQFHYVYNQVNGDATIIARVVSVENGDYSQAGVMFRNALTNMALDAAVLGTRSNGVSFLWRSTAGQGCSMQLLPGVRAPIWVRLTRTGTNVAGWFGSDGAIWFQIGNTQSVAFGPNLSAGLAVCANSTTIRSTGTFTDVTIPPPAFGVYREKWTNLNATAGITLAALTNTALNPNWPHNPDPAFTAYLPDFETETNTGSAWYGQRLRAFVVPPTNGNYEFSIASDDISELWLSADEWETNAQRVAWVGSATLPRQWTIQANQTSSAVALRGGVRYYVETRMLQGTGPDNLAVRWKLPTGVYEEPLANASSAGTRLIPCTPAVSPPGVFIQPTNQVVSDGFDAFFALNSTNQGPVSYRWRLNGLDIPGSDAALPVYSVPRVSAANQGERYDCVLATSMGAVTSVTAQLTVLVDTTPPALSGVFYVNPTNVSLFFSEPLELLSATNLANYVFTNGLQVTAARLEADGRTIALTTSPLTFGSNYVILVSNLRDRATTPNTLPPDTVAFFTAAPYVLAGIGNPSPPGQLVGADGGYDITGGGTGLGGTSDQFHYAYELLSGDFDVRVRLKTLGQTDPLARAGLMMRENLLSNSRFAGVFATPVFSGCAFLYRSSPGAGVLSVGNAAVNYPETWVRLRRTGDLCTGYASFDGLVWQQLGSATLPIGNPVYLGMAVTSRNPTYATLAQFRDLSDVTNAQTGSLVQRSDLFGPSSRRTGLTISEIMYHPAARTDGRRLEFIELFNSLPFAEEISGYHLTGDISYTFPAGTVLGAGAYLVVAANPDDLKAVYGIQNVVGPFTNNLSNSSGTVRLRNKIRAVLLEVEYDSQSPWPASADGAGHSLVLLQPSYGEGDPRAWGASDVVGGSPGTMDGVGGEPNRGVVINEVLAHTDPPWLDQVELFNTTGRELDLSGCWLTDDLATNKFRVPDGKRIGARGFLAFNENELGFRLEAGGETLYLYNPGRTRVLSAVRFEPQQNGVSSGCVPDGMASFRPLAAPTFGTNNSPASIPPVVLNELMYYPISYDDDDQYVELHNRTGQAISLAGWKFTAGIEYTFPSNAVLAANGYVVVARNLARMLTNYSGLNPAIVYGDFGGALAHRGERVVIAMPDEVLSTNAQGVLLTNTIYIPVSEVTYGTGGRWGQWAHGGGSSLELLDPRADTTLAPSWADSDETGKAPWSVVEYTGVLDNGSGTYGPSQLQLFMMGEGECLVDNVEVFRPGENNRISNPYFDNGTTGWAFQGTHRLTAVDGSGGYGGGPCLHVRASGRGDTGPNRIRTVLTTALANGNTATLRARVRWLKGDPELLLKLLGNHLEAAGRFALPANLGTPGARNSRYIPNSPPAIVDVSHSPVLPAAGQAVLVTARVTDPDRVSQVFLKYRNDTAATAPVTLEMADTGTGGDLFAKDGIYSAILPGATAGTLLAFHVQATDAHSTPASATFPNDAPTRECLVRFGETYAPGVFGNYRTWVTRTNVSWWSSREKNSNEPLDATFVYGNFRVVYNMRTLYSGSPFHTRGFDTPTGSWCDYVLTFPDDDRLLGANDFVIATPGNGNNDNTTYQREQAALWVLQELGVPSLYRRYVVMFVNGVKRGTVLEDAQQPSGDVVDEYFPDDNDGSLHKIEDWFEFADNGVDFANVQATLDVFSSGGVKKVARYRWCWRPRAVKGSSNDFTNLFALVDAVHASRPEPYTTQVEGLIDVEEWMRIFALERFVGNWDSFSYDRGKNMYAYKPKNGKWQMLPWDIDFVWDLGDPTTQPLFGGHDSSVNTMRSHPPFQRAYYRAFKDLLDGPLQASRINPMLDNKQAALVANGVPASSPVSIKNYITQRRAYVETQLVPVSPAFAVGTPVVTDNLAEITGTAPVKVKSILFNGNEYPVTWTTVTNWRASVPLQAGANPVSVVGLDSYGQFVGGTSNFFTIQYQGNPLSPVGQLVVNEIMFAPKVAGAEYVELFNNSTNLTFDLSGWEFRGLGYTFPGGSTLTPRGYLLLVKDQVAFNAAYGTGLPVRGIYTGNLQADGETLTLIKPGPVAGTDLTVAKVRYRNAAPWPDTANFTGASAQLVDSREDNWRVANWTVASTNAPVPPPAQWIYATATGTATANKNLYIYLGSAGDIYLDDIVLVAGATPGQGANLLTNGGFESSLSGVWTLTADFTQSAISTSVKRTGNSSLHLIATAAGGGSGDAVYQTIPSLVNASTYSLSFWYLQSTNGGPLVARLSGGNLTTGNINPAPPGAEPVAAAATPGKTNSVAANLPAFQALYINEVQAQNLTGLTNRAGQRTPWLELFNPSTNSVSLDGLYLANQFTNLTAWAFPTGVVLKAREFKVVFADGRTDLSTTNEPHASFTLGPAAGVLALSRLYNNKPQVLDYLEYTNLVANYSYGSVPDGQSFDRNTFFYVTPAATNNIASPPLTVVINEWMASNTNTLRNPVTGRFDDWFELYNYGIAPANLTGFYLTDTLTNQFKFAIPAGYTIPPKGFLLVWADDRNTNGTPDLHARFKMDKDGESLGLYGADGRAVDYVNYGPQEPNVSEGRYPDGSFSSVIMPSPTPGTNNIAPNTLPTLEPIADGMVTFGQTLRLTCTAWDEDLPRQSLTFSLGPGAPSGATIDPVSGVFLWTPSFAPASQPLRIVVTDSGIPPLSVTNSFTVHVHLPPQVTDVVFHGDGVSLTVNSLLGQEYQLEYSDDLAVGVWLPAGAAVPGTGAPISLAHEMQDGLQRYYRVKVALLR